MSKRQRKLGTAERRIGWKEHNRRIANADRIAFERGVDKLQSITEMLASEADGMARGHRFRIAELEAELDAQGQQ